MKNYHLNIENTQLLIIDFQEKLVPVMDESEKTVKNAGTLIKIAQSLNLPITVTEQYPQGIGYTIEPLKNELLNINPIEKLSFTAATDEVLNELKSNQRKQILVSGIETHVCVFQSVRDLLKQDYEVYVVSDAVSSRNPIHKANGLELMKDMGAVITNTETTLFDLLKRSDHENFKELSKLIR